MPTNFTLNPIITKPYALMDLDDTLFQTLRKIEAWQMPQTNLTVATVNKIGEPLSYFTPKQAAFFNWLSHTTELIPVTARDIDEIKRVKLPFTSWQILTHGAVILDKNGQNLAGWQTVVAEKLMPLQRIIFDLKKIIETDFAKFNLRLTIHSENFLGQSQAVYLAIKQADKNHAILKNVADHLTKKFATIMQDFYIHINANNLAILPHGVHKKWAVEYLQTHCLDKDTPTFGFGDSVEDLPFLQRLDWYGTPPRGQLHEYFGTWDNIT